jgi:16S rRNA (uracil1498-N3)-methyltransferase
MHRIFLPSLPASPAQGIAVQGDEARHAARVKRLQPGDPVELFDAQGSLASATITAIEKTRSGDWSLLLAVDQPRRADPISPAIHVLAAPPKGDRLDQMIDQLSQVGATSWSPLITQRTIVEPRDTKLARLERATIESAKQCGRPWALSIHEPITLAQSLAQNLNATSTPILIADASGEALPAAPALSLRLLIGPEGGWAPEELDQARAAGATIVRFGPHTMRIETAAVAAVSILMDAARRG